MNIPKDQLMDRLDPSRPYPALLHEHIETLGRPALERLQELRLMRCLAFTYERGALTRSVWDAAGLRPQDVKSLDDFKAKVPFLNKDAIRDFRNAHNDPSGGLNCARPGELRGIGTTSGTTGDPTPIPRNARAVSDTMSLRDYWRAGLRPGDYMAHMLFTFRGGISYRSIREHDIIPIYFTHSPHELPRLFEASRRYRPTLLRNVSNPILFAIEQELERTGADATDIFKSYKGAFFGGETLGARQRALAASWGLELFEQTTLGDICPATECSAHAGMHIHEDIALVECLDPHGTEPVADGEIGELVVTSLTDRAMPLIRFRTDDLGIVYRAPCVCGVTHGRFRPLGRKGDRILVAGIPILPAQVLALVESVPEARAGLFQIIRTAPEMDTLRVRVGYDDSLLKDAPADLAGRVQEMLTSRLGVPSSVEAIHNNELLKLGPPHKIPRVTVR
jgi:phenylacetate-CoA ligase